MVRIAFRRGVSVSVDTVAVWLPSAFWVIWLLWCRDGRFDSSCERACREVMESKLMARSVLIILLVRQHLSGKVLRTGRKGLEFEESIPQGLKPARSHFGHLRHD